jgi:hypothetical protein
MIVRVDAQIDPPQRLPLTFNKLAELADLYSLFLDNLINIEVEALQLVRVPLSEIFEKRPVLFEGEAVGALGRHQ